MVEHIMGDHGGRPLGGPAQGEGQQSIEGRGGGWTAWQETGAVVRGEVGAVSVRIEVGAISVRIEAVLLTSPSYVA